MTTRAIRRSRRKTVLEVAAVGALLFRLAAGPAWPASASVDRPVPAAAVTASR